MSEYILVFDQGSSASKAFLIDKKGKIVIRARRKLNAVSPASGYWEHDASEIVSGQKEAALEIISKIPSGDEIKGLGITNQRSTIVVWDAETSKPLFHALSWQDLRGIDYVNSLKEKAQEIQNLTGLKLTPYYSISKLKWLLENVPAVNEAAESGRLRWGTVNSWLIWNLTKGKVWATDHTNAARTLLFNLADLKWDNQLQEIFSISEIDFPSVFPTCHYYGNAELGDLEIPILASIGDQQAALVGQGNYREGDALINFGTLGAVLIMIGDNPVPRKGLLLSIAFSDDKKPNYIPEGTINAAGNLIDWLKNNLNLIMEGEDLDELCSSSGERVFFFPGLVGLAAPHWRQDACSNFLGLARSTTRADLVRAAVESIAFSIAEVFLELERPPAVNISEISVGGGLAHLKYLMRFTASLINHPLYESTHAEVTAKGAAFLAGLQCAFWKDFTEIQELCKHGNTFQPDMKPESVNKLIELWKESMEVALKWHQNILEMDLTE